MSQALLVLQGELRTDGTIAFAYPVNLPPGPVELLLRESNVDSEGTRAFLDRIGVSRDCHFYSPFTEEEVAAEIDALYLDIGGTG